MISDLSEFFANCLTSALIKRLVKVSGPSVCEEVERGLAIEREHRNSVRRVHTVSEELDAEAGRGLIFFFVRANDLRDAQDTMFGSPENSSVRMVCRGSEGNLHSNATRMRHLDTTFWHRITRAIEADVHVLKEYR